jgi:large subunit ribosomal protein L22
MMAGVEVLAVAKNVRMAPRKVRLVGDAVKGKPVAEAMAMLRFMPHRAATPIFKAVKSATANAENNYDLDPNDLYVARVVADDGRTLRRFRQKARGRVGSIHKRSTHITVVVQEKES